MFENAIKKGKTGVIIFLAGGLVGVGLVLWLTRKRKQIAPSMAALPVVDVPSRPSVSGMGEHQGNQARYVTEGLDDEIEDPNVDFDLGGEY